jgi:hypothetical protein
MTTNDDQGSEVVSARVTGTRLVGERDLSHAELARIDKLRRTCKVHGPATNMVNLLDNAAGVLDQLRREHGVSGSVAAVASLLDKAAAAGWITEPSPPDER